MDAEVKEEAVRATRYLIVRWVCKGADVALFLSLTWYWGLAYWLHAFGVSTALYLVVHFWIQKTWTFGNQQKSPWVLAREFVLYLAIWAGIALLGWSVHTLLTRVGQVNWWTSLFMAALVFWPLAFVAYRYVFFGSVQDLFQLLRSLPERWRNSRKPAQ